MISGRLSIGAKNRTASDRTVRESLVKVGRPFTNSLNVTSKSVGKSIALMRGAHKKSGGGDKYRDEYKVWWRAKVRCYFRASRSFNAMCALLALLDFR